MKKRDGRHPVGWRQSRSNWRPGVRDCLRGCWCWLAKRRATLPPERERRPCARQLLWGLVREAGSPDPAYRLLNVHMYLLGVVVPRGIQGAGRDGNGLTEDALRPRSDAGRGDGAGCEGRSSPRVGQFQLSAACRRPATMPVQAWRWHGGKAARREAASLLLSADRRVSKLRGGFASPSRRHVEPVKATSRFDRMRMGAEGAPIPVARRMRRSTPAVRPVSSERSDQLRCAGRMPSG